MWSWLLALAMEDWVFHFVKLFFSRARFDFGRAASSMMGDSQSNICLKDN
ncbi:3205_t:CDS:2, partial [Paraglomus brasilianum]